MGTANRRSVRGTRRRSLCLRSRAEIRSRALQSWEVDASLVPFVANLVYFVLLAAVIIAVLGRNDFVVGISYDDDISNAIAVVNDLLSKDSRVLSEPEPVVAVSELADSSVNLVVRPWCRKEDYWSLRFDLTRKFKEELERAGCTNPYPQRDVHVHQVGASA